MSDAQIAFTDALRSAIEAARRSDAPAAVYDEARALVAQAAALLDPHRYTGVVQQGSLRGDANKPGTIGDVANPADYFPYSPIVGPRNAIAPPVQMRLDGDVMRGAVTVPAQYAGPPGMVHGGVIALIFDELLGAVGVSHGFGAFTGTLSVRYVKPTPIEAPLTMVGRIDRIEGRKVFSVGELMADGEITARGEALFIRTAF